MRAGDGGQGWGWTADRARGCQERGAPSRRNPSRAFVATLTPYTPLTSLTPLARARMALCHCPTRPQADEDSDAVYICEPLLVLECPALQVRAWHCTCKTARTHWRVRGLRALCVQYGYSAHMRMLPLDGGVRARVCIFDRAASLSPEASTSPLVAISSFRCLILPRVACWSSPRRRIASDASHSPAMLSAWS